ncbi:2OG-Fe(II) oxygenase [Pinirhizobacter soli]|uniref:2OG-Fe(II) oxygenase n=1 Tax=Pinirhizobacter soli TaxID=2786953 RepID=UPI00202A45C4|nr:2OG-Fe(II) oxygenase [Pinirhizobacter soli]
MDISRDGFAPVAAALATDGWCVADGLLTAAQTGALGVECTAEHARGAMRVAATGSSHSAGLLRGDVTQWFDMLAPTSAQAVFVARIDALMHSLNRALMFTMVESESHYAVYAIGTGYVPHVDRLRDSDERVVSAVFYLNDDWLDDEGGALRLHLAGNITRDIFPRAGTLALFMSSDTLHEVLPATRARMSIACWMRQRPRHR